MMVSPLVHRRLTEKPQVPRLLQGAMKVREGATGPCQEAVRAHFPLTGGQAALEFEPDGGKQGPLRIGVLFSGGPAPGGHNVLWGLLEGMAKGSQLIGFLGGPAGLVENRARPVTAEMVEGVHNQGGFDLLGTGRTKIEKPEQLEGALRTAQELQLDGLVVIGGDDSNTNAAVLAEFFRAKGCSTCVVGVPKTIDGDLKGGPLEISFGHDTACKMYADAIGNLMRDARSTRKYTHYVKLMGRSASHIALECALQTCCGATLIGEEVAQKKMTLSQLVEQLADLVEKRSEAGLDYGVVVLPEGLIEFVSDVAALIRELNLGKQLSKESSACLELMPKEIQQQLQMDRDPHGNVQVSKIETDRLLVALIGNELKRRGFSGKWSPQAHFFGYEARCAMPSLFDAAYCYALGQVAAQLIANRRSGYMALLTQLTRPVADWIPGAIPLVSLMDLEERKGAMRPVIRKALVDLKGRPFTTFAQEREKWSLGDGLRQSGPIQFYGPDANSTLITLQLEQG
jgi:diphosphate-dependent phosphofructokinase